MDSVAWPPAAADLKGGGTGAQPHRRSFFYGWIVVGATFTILGIAYGIQFTFGIFMPYISADTGWSRGALSLPFSVYVFVYSALGFVSGRLTDRWGPRRVLAAGGCLLGSGIVLMSRVERLWQVYAVLGLLAAAGMSAAYVPCNVTVVRWFMRKRGLALSISSTGASFGTFIFPPLATALITSCGWRNAYLLLGVLAVGSIITSASLIVRDPETVGLHPDGAARRPLPAAASIAQRAAQAARGQSPVLVRRNEFLSSTSGDGSVIEDLTLAEAQRTSAFWMLNVIFALTWLVVFMPMVHIVPFAVDLGISPLRAAMTISVIGVAGCAGRLLIGTLSDHFGRVFTLGTCLFLQALSFASFSLCSGLGLLYLAAAAFGFSYGGVTALFPALVGDFFGRVEVGSIVGFIFAAAGSTAAFGPLIGGYVYNASHSYRAAFELSAILNLAALLLLFLLKKPEMAH